MGLADLRREYTQGGLSEADLAADPFAQFERWFNDAQNAGVHEPNAMALGTVDSDGQPAVRIVLLKGFGPDGFRFFTNYESRKGRELAENPRVSLCFLWHELERQVEQIDETKWKEACLKKSPEEQWDMLSDQIRSALTMVFPAIKMAWPQWMEDLRAVRMQMLEERRRLRGLRGAKPTTRS